MEQTVEPTHRRISDRGHREATASNLLEIQRSTLIGLSVTTSLAAMATWWHLINASGAALSSVYTAIVVTLLFLASVAIASTASVLIAKAIYLALCYGIVCTLLFVNHLAPAAYLLLLPTAVAGALYGPRVSLGAAALSVALVWRAQPEAAALPAASLVFAGICSYLVLRPLHELVRQHTGQSLRAIVLTEELRDQRGQLNRTIADLHASYQLLRKTNRELALACQEADALRDLRHRFATNLSHELRTPLNVILGFSRLLYSRPELYGFSQWPDDLRRDLAEVERNAGYLSDLVDDIIDLARVDALAMPVRREATELAPVVDEAVRAVGSLARHKGLSLTVACPTDLPQLPVDSVRIRQVLYNLLSNAIRHTDRGGVHVRLERREGEVEVSVEDYRLWHPRR